MQLAFCNLYCLVPSPANWIAQVNDHTSLELAVPLYFPFDLLLYVRSGSLSGKEQTPAIALAAPCSLFLLPPENTKYKGTLLLLFFGGGGSSRGDLCHKSTTQLKPTFFYPYQLSILLKPQDV